MSPSKKLFLAATLVAVGYGIASLFGAPNPRLWPHDWARLGTSANRPPQPAIHADGSAGLARVGSVRLLPEVSAAAADPLRSAAATPATVPKSTPPQEPAVPPPQLELRRATQASSVPMLSTRPLPRAKLKNEAPRPLPMDISPDTRFVAGHVEATAYQPSVSVPSTIADDEVVSAGFASIPTTIAPTNQATWTRNDPPLQPIEPTGAGAIVRPPPWPIAAEEPLRSHVIVDGDSLAKLAGRYLDDPRRSDEIFALNRAVLSDPELLPIGSELKIPPRDAPHIPGTSSQTRMIDPSPLHAAEHRGLVPVRRLPPTNGAPPTAQLLPPTPVE